VEAAPGHLDHESTRRRKLTYSAGVSSLVCFSVLPRRFLALISAAFGEVSSLVPVAPPTGGCSFRCCRRDSIALRCRSFLSALAMTFLSVMSVADFSLPLAWFRLDVRHRRVSRREANHRDSIAHHKHDSGREGHLLDAVPLGEDDVEPSLGEGARR
jgi:hypothetical protein